MILLTTYPPLFSNQEADNLQENIIIRSQLKEKDADKIVEYLQKNGIEVKKIHTESEQIGRVSDLVWDIHATPQDTVEAIILLDEAGLPERKRTSIFEEFVARHRSDANMDSYQKDLAKNLEDEIKTYPGITDVEILIKDQLRNVVNTKPHTKVLLYVKHNGTLDDPHSELGEKMKKLVIDKVPELEENHLIFIAEKETPKKYIFPDMPN